MGLFDAFRYDGKRTLVVGGASGMGEAVVDVLLDAGAEVVVMDRVAATRDGVKAIEVDLAQPASIDRAVAECGGPLHAVFSCAGVADGYENLARINFIGHRYLLEQVIAGGMLGRGGAIGFISSFAGMNWEFNLEELHEYLDIADFEAAAQWAIDRGRADYIWSKKAVNAYVARQSLPLLKQGIRINATMPGPTDTPLAQANKDTWLASGTDYRAEAGVDVATALHQAYPLVFLCSDAAAGITGALLITDNGHFAAGVSHSFPAAAAAVGFLRTF